MAAVSRRPNAALLDGIEFGCRAREHARSPEACPARNRNPLQPTNRLHANDRKSAKFRGRPLIAGREHELVGQHHERHWSVGSRKKDFRLLTGRGNFADDVRLPEMEHAIIVRSPHAHAHIASIDKEAGLASPGGLAVVTGFARANYHKT